MRKTILLCIMLIAGIVSYQSQAAKSSIPLRSALVVTSDTVTVSTLATLQSAVQTAPAKRLVLLMNNTDAAGYYDLSAGLTFPTNKGDLTLRAVVGQKPVVRGTFKSLSGTWMALNNLTIDGITLDGNDGSAPAFTVSNKDTVSVLYSIKNSTFKNMKTGQFWYSNGSPALVQNVVIESCTVDNFGGSNVKGATGGTFVQLQNKAISKNDIFTLRNNTFTNWHGNIFFNSARQTTTDTTGINLTFENNTFYKFGGNAPTVRNFIEWANVPKWYKVKGSSTGTDTTVLKDIPFVLNIRNNFFYKNQADTLGKLKIVKLFAPNSTNQIITLNFQKNVYDPTEVGFQLNNTTRVWTDSTSSTLAQLGITGSPLVNDTTLAVLKGISPLFLAGISSTYVGASNLYIARTLPAEWTVETLPQLKNALAYSVSGDVIKLKNCIDAGNYYDLSAGLTFPTHKGDLTLKAADGQKPVARGTFKSFSGTWMILNNLTIDGITLDGNDGSAAAFTVSNRDTVSTLYSIKNCTFKNMKSGQFWYSNGSPALIQNVTVENCTVDNFGGSNVKGATGGTFVQLQNKTVSRNDKFTFRNNTFTNWHGNIFFNSARQTTTDTTGINVTIDNNTFYKFGGNAPTVRNFVEWANVPKWYKVKGSSTGTDTTVLKDIPFVLNIRNNFFYKNQADTLGKLKIVKLFAPNSTNQVITLNFQKNVYDPTEVGFQLNNTTRIWTDSTSSTLAQLGITGNPLINDSTLLAYKNFSPLYTAGLAGTYVGTSNLYTARTVASEWIVENLAQLKNALAYNLPGDVVKLKNCTDAGNYYDLSAGLTFPTHKGDLTLKAADGQKPVARGTFKSFSGTWMILNNLTIDGITIDGNDGSAPAFTVSNRDTVSTLYSVKNCTFKNMKSGQFWYSNGSPALIQNVTVENCTVDNFGGSNVKGATGGTFVQLQNKTISRNDNFVFRNNTFTNWHGNIFFNSARQTTTDTTGINVTIDNNTFYKFGGNAPTVRNFIEWANVPKWYKVKGSSTGTDTTVLKDIPFVLNIRNNFFHKNQADTIGKLKIVKLFAPNSANQVITLNFQKNVYDPTEVGFQLNNTTRVWTDSTSSTLAQLNITSNPLVNDSTLAVFKGFSPLYTAGIAGTYVGTSYLYVNRSLPTEFIVENLAQLKNALDYAVGGDVIKLKNNTDAVGYYDLNAGLTFPTHKGDLTLKALDGQKPVARGTFKSYSGTWMILNNLTIDGIILDGADGSAQAFTVSNRDTVLSTYSIKNCTFKNQKTNQFWYSNGTPALIQNVVVENCLVDNFGGSNVKGATGGTFVQLQNKTISRNDNFVFRNNTFTNWHGNIFFNSARQTTTDTTGINLTFEHNTFFKFGGNAPTVRNFVEWANVPRWYKVKGSSTGADTTINKDIPFTLNIRSNFFYGNQADTLGKLKIVKLFAPNSANQIINLNFQKNVYNPNEVGFQLNNTTRIWTDSTSSTIAGLGILTDVFVNKALAESIGDLTMYKQTAMYTYGIGGTCAGDPRWYTSDATPITGLKDISKAKLEAYSDGSMIYVRGTEKSVTLFNMMGQRLGTYSPEDAEHGIAIRNKGLVIITSDGATLRLMVR
jgi:hypothetical protein